MKANWKDFDQWQWHVYQGYFFTLIPVSLLCFTEYGIFVGITLATAINLWWEVNQFLNEPSPLLSSDPFKDYIQRSIGIMMATTTYVLLKGF